MTEIKIDAPLSPAEECIWLGLCDGERSIPFLFQRCAKDFSAGFPMRAMQQRIGSMVCRINKKVSNAGYRIVPGDARNTYKIIKL
jgi:hypothetical protein